MFIKKSKTEEVKPPRYNEKDAVKDFLNSKNGISKMIDKLKEFKENQSDIIFNGESNTKKSLEKCIDSLIDFYIAWIFECPAKSFHKKSHYQCFKKLEKYCDLDEVTALFDYLL